MLSSRGVRKGVVFIATAVFLVGWVVVLPPAAAAKGGFVTYNAATRTYAISPTGSDDTANIQAAFDGCVSHGPQCTVQLTKGTFYTGMIAAENFRGKFQGMGERWTMVEALPDLPSPTANPFWAAMPGPQNQWPTMFVFLNGSFAVSGIAFREPYNSPGQGWEYPFFGTIHALWSAILIVGGHADAAIDQVTVQGAAGDYAGFNILDAIMYEGLLTKPGWTNPLVDLFPISGTFLVTNSAIYTTDNPIGVSNLLGAHVTVRGNTFQTMEGGFLSFDAYDSSLEVSGNRATDVFDYAGVIVWQDEYVAGTLPTRLLVMDNEFWVTNGAVGVWIWDFGTVRTLNAVVVGNDIHLDETSCCGVLSISTAFTEASQNEIIGPGAYGVYIIDGPGIVGSNEIRDSAEGVVLSGATGVLVKGNEIKDSEEWGIAVVGESSDNVIARNEITSSGVVDLYWDQTGSGNVWTKNECLSSDPPGLCSGN